MPALSTLVRINYGKGLPSGQRNPSGSVPVYGSSGLVGYHTEALSNGPCIIIGRKGANGAVHVSDGPCWPIDTTFYIETPSSINIRYLAYYLIYANLGAVDRSTTIPSLTREDLSAVEVPLPSLSNQERMVQRIEELLSRLDEGKSALRQAEVKLAKYHAGVLQHAVNGKLTERWRAEHPDVEPASKILEQILRERRQWWEEGRPARLRNKGRASSTGRMKYSEPVKPKVSNLPPLPSGWCWATIDQICLVGTGSTPSRQNPEYWENGSIPWIRSEAANNPFITSAEEYVTELAVKECNLSVYPAHTLVVALYGAGRTRGKTAELLIDAAVNQALATLQVFGTASRYKDYLKLFLSANYASMRAMAGGGVQPNLNLGLVKTLPVPLPPLAELDVILGKVSLMLEPCDELSRIVSSVLRRAQILRQVILRSVFQESNVEL